MPSSILLKKTYVSEPPAAFVNRNRGKHIFLWEYFGVDLHGVTHINILICEDQTMAKQLFFILVAFAVLL